MSPEEARQAVSDGAWARLMTGPGDIHAEGRIVAYSIVPTVTVVTATGDRIDWRHDMAERIKPPEPTGLGAVVEDASGTRWVRLERDVTPWADGKSFAQRWRDLDVVRVLSEGMPS